MAIHGGFPRFQVVADISWLVGNMESEEVDVCVAAVIIVSVGLEKRKPKRLWSDEYLLKRDTVRSYASMFNEVRLNTNIFNKYLGISATIFD